MFTKSTHAFSLVELSIVLVILGLLVGGVLSGQSLIRAAELRSISADFSRYTTAVYSFRDKYQALPGDMASAVRFWGAQAGGTSDGSNNTCSTLDGSTPSTGKATCNGDGDGRISDLSNFGNASSYEANRMWQHLANAGLIEGQYAGVPNGGASDIGNKAAVRWGWNAPASKLGNSGYLVHYWRTNWEYESGFCGDGDCYFMQADFDSHVLILGSSLETGGYDVFPGRFVLTAQETWNLDTKMDDGKPGLGKVLSSGTQGIVGCVDNTNKSGTYQLDRTEKACGVIFKPGF